MGHNPVESWKNQIQWYSETNYFSELKQIDGKPIEFKWNIFILNKIHKMIGELQCVPADFKGRIICMSMFNDIEWEARGNEESCENNSKRVEEYARRFPRGHWSFLGPGSEKKWYATYKSKPNGCWDRTAEKMMQHFQRSGHPIFRCTSALRRGQLRSKGGGRTTIHFTACDENVQLLLKMIISVNQLSLYGAVADSIKELADDQRAPGKPVGLDQMEEEFLTQPPLQKCKPMTSDRETCCKITNKDLKNYQKTRSYPNCAPKQVWFWSKLGDFSMLFRHRMERRIDLDAENTHYLEMKRKIVQKGGSKAMHDSALSRT